MQNGKLAQDYCNLTQPIHVLKSAAGFYIGTVDQQGPVSRESVEYWPTSQEAVNALLAKSWTQRSNP